MRNIFKFLVLIMACLTVSDSAFASVSAPASASASDVALASKTISERWLQKPKNSVNEMERWVGLDNGRLKPLLTFAREQILFVSGHYTHDRLPAIGWIVGGSFHQELAKIQIINIRSSGLREALGLTKSQRWVSVADLKTTPLQSWAEPLINKASSADSFLEPQEKEILEVFRQLQTVEELQSGRLLQNFLGPSAKEFHKKFLQSPASIEESSSVDFSKVWPSSLEYSRTATEIEIILTNTQPFFWAGVLLLLSALVLASSSSSSSSGRAHKLTVWLNLVSLLLIGIGFVARVFITGFAPVTNMYGTMIWVSLGLSLVSFWLISQKSYRLLSATFAILTGSLLIFTESVPLVLSPHLDPIVAVLRSNFWLTIHVLTIVMSYALLASATVLAHILVVQKLRAPDSTSLIKSTHHLMYKLTQIGVFTLSVGIVLGGIWADYSWGRFWGWDPKETWALIADLGFLAVLHARYIKKFDLFFECIAIIAAFLLVIMAWYGVNFILAAGLHSYGFSSGGATIVSVFVALEIIFITVCSYLFLHRNSAHPERVG